MSERISSNLEKLVGNENTQIIRESQVILMAGFPGSGKSWIGQAIAQETGAQILVSDKIRQNMYVESGGLEKDSGLYGPKSEAVYSFIREHTVALACRGIRVVVDATHMNNHRQLAINSLRDANLLHRSVLVLVESAPEKILARQLVRDGYPGTGETWAEGWQRVYEWFNNSLRSGKYTYPSEDDGIRIVRVKNG